MRHGLIIGRASALGIALALTFRSAGQPAFTQPKYFLWADYPPETHFPAYMTFTDNYMVKAIRPNLTYPLYHPDGTVMVPTPRADPVGSADWVFEQIDNEIYNTGRLAGLPVCVMMQGIGLDSVDCDAGWNFATSLPYDDPDVGSPRVGGHLTSSIRFYHPDSYPEGDRLPWIAEWDNQSSTHRFPDFRVSSVPVAQGRDGNDYGGARSYRHPFLRNANNTVNGDGTYKAPLREWMRLFVNELETKIQNSRTSGSRPLPLGRDIRWYFDTEPLTLNAGRNGVFMLRELADPSRGFWDTGAPDVPGFGHTLGYLYNASKSSFGGQDDLRHATTGLDPSADADAPRNRGPMRWYYEICQNVHDQVMNNCVYSVLQSKWGSEGHPVRCGNYNDYTVDGGLDRFGWSQDRPWQGSLTTSNGDYPPWDPASWVSYPAAEKEQYPRLVLDKGRGGPFYYLGSNSYLPRWTMLKAHGSGTVGSPSMYRLGLYEYEGREAWYQCPAGPGTCVLDINDESQWYRWGTRPGHQRWNRYRPNTDSTGYRPEESPWESALRMHRNNAESFLNSVDANSNPTGSSNTLVPWVQMCAVTVDGVTGEVRRQAADFTTRDETRKLLWILRSKNTSEGLFWTGWYNRGGPDDEAWRNGLKSTWEQTERVLHEVYEPYIDTYSIARGLSSYPPATPVPSKLEFTLRSSGADVTVDIPGIMQSGGASSSELTVDFVWPTTPWPIATSVFQILSAIECGSTVQNATVQVFAYNQPGNSWTQLYTEQDGASVVTIDTPASADGIFRTRQYFVSSNLSTSAIGNYRWARTISGVTKSVTRLKLRYDASSAFTSKTDLVQLAMVEVPSIGGLGAGAANTPQEFSMADTNFDGVVDELDAFQFLDDYETMAPPADFNMDTEIDETDLASFLEVFVNQP